MKRYTCFSRVFSKEWCDLSFLWCLYAGCLFACGQLQFFSEFQNFIKFKNQNVFQDILRNFHFYLPPHTPFLMKDLDERLGQVPNGGVPRNCEKVHLHQGPNTPWMMIVIKRCEARKTSCCQMRKWWCRSWLICHVSCWSASSACMEQAFDLWHFPEVPFYGEDHVFTSILWYQTKRMRLICPEADLICGAIPIAPTPWARCMAVIGAWQVTLDAAKDYIQLATAYKKQMKNTEKECPSTSFANQCAKWKCKYLHWPRGDLTCMSMGNCLEKMPCTAKQTMRRTIQKGYHCSKNSWKRSV